MSNVNADATQLLTILKNMRTSISSIETTRSSVKMKYQQLGIGWNDKKYDELGTIVKDCNKALNDILQIMLQAEKYVASLAKSVQEYDNVNLDTPSARNSFLQGLQTPNVGNSSYQYCLGVLTQGSTPDGYIAVISQRHENAEQNVREVFDHFAGKLMIQDSEYPPDQTAHYSPGNYIGHSRGVYYNAASDMTNPRGAGTTYFHELAHMIDHASCNYRSNLSNTPEFAEALVEDGQRILSLYNNLPVEKQTAFLTRIRQDSAHSFSDLIDATTNGQLHGNYGHSRNTIKGGCIMDIWHRVGRIVRFSNLGTLLFFTLNILLIVAVFGSSGSIVELICIYFFTVAISLSPLGEMCLAAFAGASDIKRVDIKLRVVPLVQYVLDKAKENTSYCPKKVKVKIIHDPAPNAFALGRQTLCITDGLLLLSDDMILGILAHEIGHLSYGHTVIQLLIGGGNIFISGCLLLIKISYWIFSAIMGLFAICSRSGVMGIITAVFAGISTALSWLWVKFCMLFLMWSMRQNEYLADEFAYKIGFGLELATVLDQHISDVPHDGFLSAIYSTHPCNDDRVAALQNLGVPYSRY